jgi:hypothetical protein
MKTEDIADLRTILYLHTNKNTGRVYLGVHRTDEDDDGYITSSTCPYFKQDWTLGLFKKREKLFEGSYREAINLEHQLLAKYDAVNNPNFYNKSNGGGALVDKNYIVDEKVFQEACEWIEGKKTETVVELPVSGQYRPDHMEKLYTNIKFGMYETVEYSVEILYTLDKNQVRMNLLDEKHVEELVDYFKYPAEARKNLTPIIVSIDKNKLKIIIDGNHRINAAYRAGWSTIPVILLDDSEFFNDVRNYTQLGLLLNDKPNITLGNNLDDLDRQIYIISKELDYLEIDSDEFISILKSRFGGKGTGRKGAIWKDSSITKRCKSIAAKNAELALQQGKNFISYSKTKLDNYKRAYKFNFPKVAVITQGIDSICNAGFGGITSMMSEENRSEGVIIVHYGSKYSNWEDRNYMIDKFNKQVEKILAPGLSVKLVFLDAFKEGFEHW